MTLEILLTLGVTAGALGLFVWNRIRVDVVGVMVMTTLIVLGLVSVREGISGFANEAMITVAAMFVLSAGLLRTGAIDLLGKWMARVAGGSELRLLAVSIVIVVPLSAFINNTPVVVVMIPMVLGLSRKTGARPSKLFIPISFASQMGGTLTLIGTSTNLLVAGLVLELGMDRIGLFDITPPALALTAIGLVYLLTLGRWLTPVRASDADVVNAYELRDYLSVLEVGPESPLVGRSLAESKFASRFGLEVVRVDRGEQHLRATPATHVEAGDLLVVRGTAADIAKIEEVAHLVVAPEARPDPDFGALDAAQEDEEVHLAEILVPPRSGVVGRTLRQLNFRARYGVPVLGIQRHGVSLAKRLRDVVLAPGDLLLVQATSGDLLRLHERRDLAVLGALDPPKRRVQKLKFALPILVAVVLLAAFDVLPILVSALFGALAMVLTGCLTPDEAYEEMDWMVLVLLGSVIPLGIAMQNTGTATFIAEGLVSLTTPLGLFGALAAFYLMTSLLTELISNNAAAIVLTPIAIATAAGLGVSPMPFVIAVMIAASNSYLTPIGYQTNTFILGPGGYRFSDFLRVGGPLTVLMVLAATFVIPVFFPFLP